VRRSDTSRLSDQSVTFTRGGNILGNGFSGSGNFEALDALQAWTHSSHPMHFVMSNTVTRGSPLPGEAAAAAFATGVAAAAAPAAVRVRFKKARRDMFWVI
jgi:hypothetical protein